MTNNTYKKEINSIVTQFKEHFNYPLIINEWSDRNFDNVLDLIANNYPEDLQNNSIDFVKKESSKFDLLAIKELERLNLLHILLQ